MSHSSREEKESVMIDTSAAHQTSFGHAMDHILAKRSRAEKALAWSNGPDMPCTKKGRLGFYHIQIRQ